MRRTCVLAVAILATQAWMAGRLSAAVPSLTHGHPAGVVRGGETEVKLVGTFDPWPCPVWAAAPGVVFTPGKEAGVFSVSVAAEVSPGPCLIRAFNAEGASAPIALVIADSPQTPEVEPNNVFRSPQWIEAATATINGRHEKADDVDCFGVTLAAGQTLVAWVEAYVLAAGFDSMLRVVDDSGRVVAFNHDHVTLDPFLTFKADTAGKYVVQTMGHAYPASSDIRFSGGPTCVYRLHLSAGPVVRNTWPLGLNRAAAAAEVALEGWNLSESRVLIDPAAPPAHVPVVLSDLPESVESGGSSVLAVPSAVSGRLDTPGQIDTYTLNALKDVPLLLTVGGRRLGSEIDPWLKIRAPDGKELATSDDDGGFLEPRLAWTAPADGAYAVEVGDLTRRGGPLFYYRLTAAPAAPGVGATVGGHAFKVEAGKSTEIKVSVAPVHGFKSKLKLAAIGLPAGVAAAELDVPEAGGEVSLPLTADPSAAPHSAPFRIVLRESDTTREHSATFALATTGENNGVPQGYQKLLVDTTDALWLTVVKP